MFAGDELSEIYTALLRNSLPERYLGKMSQVANEPNIGKK